MAKETDGEITVPKTAGLYRHTGTGVVVELDETPGVGTPLIDAFVKMGYVKVTEEEMAAEKSEPTASAGSEDLGNGYTAKMTKRGMQYRLNGRIISKEDFDNRPQ